MTIMYNRPSLILTALVVISESFVLNGGTTRIRFNAHQNIHDYHRGGASEASGATLTDCSNGNSRYMYVKYVKPLG